MGLLFKAQYHIRSVTSLGTEIEIFKCSHDQSFSLRSLLFYWLIYCFVFPYWVFCGSIWYKDRFPRVLWLQSRSHFYINTVTISKPQTAEKYKLPVLRNWASTSAVRPLWCHNKAVVTKPHWPTCLLAHWPVVIKVWERGLNEGM